MNRLRFPRTYDEAFRTTEYACAVERPPRKYPKALWVAMVIGFLAALIAARAT